MSHATDLDRQGKEIFKNVPEHTPIKYFSSYMVDLVCLILIGMAQASQWHQMAAWQ